MPSQVLLAFAARQRLQRHAATDDTYDVGVIDAGEVHLGQAVVASRDWIGCPKSSHHIARCKGLVPAYHRDQGLRAGEDIAGLNIVSSKQRPLPVGVRGIGQKRVARRTGRGNTYASGRKERAIANLDAIAISIRDAYAVALGVAHLQAVIDGTGRARASPSGLADEEAVVQRPVHVHAIRLSSADGHAGTNSLEFIGISLEKGWGQVNLQFKPQPSIMNSTHSC